MTRSSENRCFRRFQETRDPRLLGKVFDATAAELLRVAGHLANGDLELTKDALQATFLTAIEQADSYDTERDVRPWLLVVSHAPWTMQCIANGTLSRRIP